jgi:AcrR family transcriptional regulator
MRSDDARERILATADELFSHRSVRAVGIGEVIERASVAKATLYRHFASKDALVLAFLVRRGQLWTRDVLEAGARSRGSTPELRLLALFDVLDDSFRSEDYESCSFVGVLLEMGPDHPLGRAAILQLDGVLDVVRRLAVEAGLHDPLGFAGTCQILINGSIVAAVAGDTGAALRARRVAQSLVDRDRIAS